MTLLALGAGDRPSELRGQEGFKSLGLRPSARCLLCLTRLSALGGVGLEGEAKERFNEIQQELSQLSTKFSNNLLDGTKAFKKLVENKTDIEGLPPSALALGAQTAQAEGHEGATPEVLALLSSQENRTAHCMFRPAFVPGVWSFRRCHAKHTILRRCLPNAPSLLSP